MSAAPARFRELVFREDWKAIPAARPITQEHVAHHDLELALHGPGAGQIKKSHHEDIPGDPYYVWSGKCVGSWALSLRHRGAWIDLSHSGLVRWRARQSGSRRLRLILKAEEGPWLVSDSFDGASACWREFDIEVAKETWRRFDIESCKPLDTPSGVAGGVASAHGSLAHACETLGFGFAHVDAIGVTDLMHGDGSSDCSRLDWIEVWGRPVARTSP